MGFAVRADQNQSNSVEGSRKRNLVLLHPVDHNPVNQTNSSSANRVLFEAPVQQVASPEPAAPAEIKQLPTTPRLPLGLKLLVGVQQGSTIVTGSLVATALVIYSWTVYLDKTVARSFQRLETLKASIQQVITANATLKNSMAEQAEAPSAGFKPFEPERAIFLQHAPARPLVEPSFEPEIDSPIPHPLGY